MSPHARKFDWDEAKRLREEGLTYEEIGRRLGVSAVAAHYACDPAAYAASNERAATWQRQGICPDCGAQTTRHSATVSSRCRKCYSLAKASSVRPTELRCVSCREWLPDPEFPRHRRNVARRGRHRQCRECNTVAKRAWRQRQKGVE